MDYKDFSAKIKSKYPQYADMDDKDLAQKMVAKFPQYNDVTFDSDMPAPEQPKQGIVQKGLDVAGKALGVLNIPTQALGTLRGYDIKDKESYLLRPEVEKANQFLDKNMLMTGDKNSQEMSFTGPGTYYASNPEMRKQQAQATLQSLGQLASDPLNYLGGAARMASKLPESLNKVGKDILQSGMKIKDVTAKQAGINVNEGVEKIVDDIAKYDLGSKTKGYEGIAENAGKAIKKRMNDNEALIQDYAKENPIAGANVTKAIKDFSEEIRKGKSPFFTNEEEAAKFAESINKSLELRGLDGYRKIDELPKIKQTIKEGLDLFSDGKFAIGDAPMKEKLGDLVYLKIIDKIGEKIPQYNATNKEVHDIINVEQAALEAAKRTGNKNKIGLMDELALIGGGPALASMGLAAGSSVAPLVVGGVIAKKALSNGRGASTLLDLSKVSTPLKSLKNTPSLPYGAINQVQSKDKKKTLKDLAGGNK